MVTSGCRVVETVAGSMPILGETFRHPMWSNKKEFSISYPMRSSRLLLVFCVFLCGVGAGFAVNPASSAPVTPILPQQFGGWQMQGAAQTSSDPGAATLLRRPTRARTGVR